MENIKELASYCQNPVRVYNRYTGEDVLSSCGVCSSCLMKKRSRRMSSLLSYSSTHPHCLFVTLTYTDECIPFFFCSELDSEGFRRPVSLKPSGPVSLLFDYECLLRNRISFFERILRCPSNIVERNIRPYLSLSVINSYKSLLSSYSLEDDSVNSMIFSLDPDSCNLSKCLSYISSRCSLRSSIPFPLVSDFQNFIKRIRKKILKKYGKKISYYAVSEYGPRSLRPHWHLMLFFDDLEFSQVLSEIVRSCWLFGSCDTQLARSTGASASYVASYLNSSCSLPELYLHSQALRPRCLHSCGISSAHLFPVSSSVEEAESIISRCLDGVGLRNSGGVVSISPPSSYIGRVFPRFRGIVRNDSSQLYDLYSSSLSLIRCYLNQSGLRFESVRTSCLVDYVFLLLSRYRTVSSIPECSSLRFVAEALRLSNMHFKESFVRGGLVYNRFYRFFSKIFGFVRFWQVTSSASLRKAVSCVIEFHSRRDSLLLASQYNLLSSFDRSSVMAYYSLCGYKDYHNYYSGPCRSYNDLKISASIKHKLLNDNMLSSLC